MFSLLQDSFVKLKLAEKVSSTRDLWDDESFVAVKLWVCP